MAKKQKGMRPDNRIQVTLTICIGDDGKPVRKSFYGSTKTEAIEKRDEYKKKLRLGIVDEGDVMTVGTWVDHCLDLYRGNVDEHYVKEDAVPYNRLKSAIGRMKISSVREADLQRLLNEFAADKSYSSVSKYYHAIKLVFSKARRNKLIIDDPSEDLQMPKAESGSHRALTGEEIECINRNWQSHRSGIWVLLMLYAGLRRGEMIALIWSNVDLKERSIYVREAAVIESNQTIIVDRTKTEAGIRTIPICDALYDALCTVPEEQRTGYVCLSANGQLLTKSAFVRGWNGFNLAMTRLLNGEPVDQQGRRTDLATQITKATDEDTDRKIFQIRAHDLRHTFCTALYDAGIDVKSAQYYMGHSDIRMTMDLYTHISKERATEQRDKLLTFFKGWHV